MFEDKVVEVDNKENYYVIKQLVYNNNIYLLTNMLIDEENLSEDFYIIKVLQVGDNLKMIIEQDENTLNTLKQKFAEALEF